MRMYIPDDYDEGIFFLNPHHNVCFFKNFSYWFMSVKPNQLIRSIHMTYRTSSIYIYIKPNPVTFASTCAYIELLFKVLTARFMKAHLVHRFTLVAGHKM